MAKLSIITINYNSALDLEKTILSVIKQSWTDYEYIIIDGGSTDNSVDIIKQHQKYIHYWVSEKDKGVFDAMNKGIAVATGEYLLMLNAGDLLYNESVLQKASLQNHAEDLIYGDVLREAGGNIIGKSIFPDTLTFGFLRRGALSHQATFIKRILHDKIGLYDSKLKFSSDWKFILLAVCKYDASYKHIAEVFSVCNSEGLTCSPANFNAMEAEMTATLLKYFPAIIPDYLQQDKLDEQRIGSKVKRAKASVKNRIRKILSK